MEIPAEVINNVASGFVISALGLVGYLIKHYFVKIAESQQAMVSSLDKLSGRLDGIQKDLRENTTESAVMRNELRAIWRFIDHAHERASDNTNGEYDDE